MLDAMYQYIFSESIWVQHKSRRLSLSLLKIDRLAKAYGVGASKKHAVRGISFTVQKGEVVAFLGPNGAGKSTTMRMVSGYLEPDSGDAFIAGASIRQERENAQIALGYLAEGAPLYGDLTARGFLTFLAGTHGLSASQTRWALDRVIADARIETVIDRSIDTLSKGYKRRVGLAGAIIHDPPVLVLDEPTDGLDPNQKRAVRSLIDRMSKEKAILISTHQLDEVQAMCSRAVVIDGGKIVADDTPAGLVDNSVSHNLEDAFSLLTHEEGEQA